MNCYCQAAFFVFLKLYNECFIVLKLPVFFRLSLQKCLVKIQKEQVETVGHHFGNIVGLFQLVMESFDFLTKPKTNPWLFQFWGICKKCIKSRIFTFRRQFCNNKHLFSGTKESYKPSDKCTKKFEFVTKLQNQWSHQKYYLLFSWKKGIESFDG